MARLGCQMLRRFSTTTSIREDASADFDFQVSGTLLWHTEVDRDFLRDTRSRPRRVSPTADSQSLRISLPDHAIP